MSAEQIPPYLKPSLVGRACGMSRRKAKAMLKSAGILELIGSHHHVGQSQLRERLPEVYDRVYAFIVLGTKETQRGGNGRKQAASLGPHRG